MASRHDIVQIDFRANAGRANAAVESLRKSAKGSRDEITRLKQELNAGIAAGKSQDWIDKQRNSIKALEKELKAFEKAERELVKGVDVLSRGIDAFNNGSLDKMSAAMQKAIGNAARLARSKMTPDTAQGKKDIAEMDALIMATDKNLVKSRQDFAELVNTIKTGGKTSTAELSLAKEQLKELMNLKARGTKEWKGYEAQLKVIEAKFQALTLEEQRMAGQNALKQVFSGTYVTKTRGELEKMIQTLRQYQSAIADPEGKGARHFKATEKAIQSLTTQLGKAKEASAVQVLGNMSGFGVDQIRQAVQQMTQLRDSFHEGTKEWNKYNALVKQGDAYLQSYAEREKIARGEAVSLADALKLSSTAGTSGFKGTAQQLQLAQQAIEKALSTTDKGTAKYQKLQQALARVKAEMTGTGITSQKMQEVLANPKAVKSVDTLKQAVGRSRAEMDVMAQKLERMNQLLAQAQKNGNTVWAERLKNSIKQTSQALDQQAKSTKEADLRMKELQATSKGTVSAFDKAWSRLKTYVGLYVGAAVAMQKVTATMGDLMELSDKMGEVRKTTGFTADEVGRLTTELKKLDVRTPLVGLLEISASAGQLGLKTMEDIQGFTESANKLMIALPEMGKEAATELMRVAIATGEVDKIRKQMEEGTVEGSSATAVAMEKIGSTIDRLRASSASTAPEITDFVKRLGAVGAQSGITVDQVAALGSTISSLGMRVEMSATALSRMIPAIRNNAYDIGAIIGKTEEDIKRRFAEGQGMSVILDLFRAIRERSGITAEGIENDADGVADKVEKMMEAAGFQDIMKELNQQGARAGIVFAGLSQNVEQLEYQLGVASEAYEENIAIQKEFDRMNETTAAKWERLKNQFEEAFIGDWSQSFLGGVIDMLRWLVDFITGRVEGVLAGLRVAFLAVAAGVMAYRIELGKLFLMESFGGLAKLWKLMVSMKDTIVLSTMYTGQYIALKWKLIWATKEEEKATIRAKIAQLGLNKAMAANVFMAVATAILTAYLVLKDWIGGTDLASKAVENLNQKIDEEKDKLNRLVNAYHDANGNLDKRKNLMNEINQKYSQYLGFLLTDAENSNLVALAHERIAAALESEMLQRERAQSISGVRQQFQEDLTEQWAEFTEELRKQGLNAEQIAQARNDIQSFLQSLQVVNDKVVFGGNTLTELNQYIRTRGDRNTWMPNKDEETIIATWVDKYLSENYPQMYATSFASGVGKDVEGEWNKTGGGRFAKYAETYVNMARQVAKTEDQIGGFINAAEQRRANTTEGIITNLQTQATKAVEVISNVNSAEEDIAKAYEDLAGAIEGLDRLSGELKSSTRQADQTAVQGITNFVERLDVQQVNQQKLQDARTRSKNLWNQLNPGNGIGNDSNGNGNGGRGSYGNYDKRVDPYEQWDANALVKRREEMLKRVRALAGGADVQTVLSMDKRFMDEATRKGIKNMRDAIAWYNEERLKIQEELHSRNLTNTGDWMDPKKGGSKRKPKTPESEAAIAELDRYYLERKELIEEARSKEEMTEAEYNRRLDALEMEHLQKRSDLRKTFTSDDKQFIQQFRQWWASVAELDEVSWETIEAEWIAAFDRDRKYNNRAAQKDLTAMQAIIVKQLHEIEAIIDKERPFNGITRNLQDNLTKMGLLFKDGVPEGDEFMKQNTERLTFLLREAENAYAMTWEQLEQDMRQNGLGAWADAILGSENADKEKRAMIAQLHEVYDAVQEAIKKEASLVKKQVDIQWNDAILPNGKSIKATYEAAISALGVQQSSVSRANSLIGAGAASDRVADRLAIRQMQLQLRMQEHYYNLVRQTGQQRVDDLLREAQLREQAGKADEAERLRLDAKHAQMSLNLSLSKEETELAKQREEIIARTEESQNRLYTELREWGDLLASSMKDIFEASAAGNEDYYNEMAKLNLTGKGGPGAGTYVVIDNAGTSDATAHYEYLDERQALERQHEIEQENAKAEAWKKVWDDLNQKMSEQITDWLNAAAQNAALDANSEAVSANTSALNGLTGAITSLQGTIAMQGAQQAARQQQSNNAPNPTIERIGYEDVEPVTTTTTTTQTATGEQTSPILPGVTPGVSWVVPEDVVAAEQAQLDLRVQMQKDAIDKVQKANEESFHKMQRTTQDTNKTMTTNTQSSFAKMALAANLYGVAYQAVSNENLSATQKWEMIALQSVGNFAISSLTAVMSEAVAKGAVSEATVLGKLWSQLGWAAAPVFAVFTGLLGAAMGAATSAVSKSKSQIAQATGSSSASAGKLATGMLTYKEGNVDAFTDPSTLTPGRQYNVDAADGRTYRARYMGSNPKTHLTNGPEFHLAGEAGREMIIDAGTTRQITMNEGEIWHAIQTLSNGGRGYSRRRTAGRGGVRAYAEGNVEEFEDYGSDGSYGGDGNNGMTAEQMAAFQSSLDRNNELLERALTEGIRGVFDVHGPGGLVNTYDKAKKEAVRHGERYT